jgi:hypothetical protein
MALGVDIWAQHGVWDIETGYVMRPDYFRFFPAAEFAQPEDLGRDGRGRICLRLLGATLAEHGHDASATRTQRQFISSRLPCSPSLLHCPMKTWQDDARTRHIITMGSHSFHGIGTGSMRTRLGYCAGNTGASSRRLKLAKAPSDVRSSLSWEYSRKTHLFLDPTRR